MPFFIPLTLSLLLTQTADAGAEPANVQELAAKVPTLSDAERRAEVSRLSREQQAELMKALPQETLVELGKRALERLNTYRSQLSKQERVGGELIGRQTVDVHVRERPFAVRMDFVDGPGKGRRVLYNSALKKDEVRAKEGGLLGVVGGVWVDIDSGLTRKDSTHRITDVGLGPLLRIIEGDLQKAKAFGGHVRSDEGFDKAGHYCLMAKAPKGAKGLYADGTRLCIDPVSALPLRVESFDAKGMFETFTYSKVQPKPLDEEFFTLKGANL